jgi:phosphate transport system substrate-binding protein
MLGVAALAATTMLAACGGDDDDDDAPAGTATTASSGTTAASATTAAAAGKIDYSKLSGSVRIDGSSTVFPISEAVAEEFSKVAKGVRANVAFSGTGGGFEKFCRGEIEVSNASRPINQKEKDACAAKGYTDVVEIQVAIDALTVVVNPQNSWATCLTPTEVQSLYKDGGAKNWKDIRAGFPDQAIKFYYPGADSGTFDYFKEAIKLRGTASNEPAHRSDGTSSEDDNVLVKGVEGDKGAVGYFGFAYFQEAG